jgi:hypothetical protein
LLEASPFSLMPDAASTSGLLDVGAEPSRITCRFKSFILPRDEMVSMIWVNTPGSSRLSNSRSGFPRQRNTSSPTLVGVLHPQEVRYFQTPQAGHGLSNPVPPRLGNLVKRYLSDPSSGARPLQPLTPQRPRRSFEPPTAQEALFFAAERFDHMVFSSVTDQTRHFHSQIDSCARMAPICEHLLSLFFAFSSCVRIIEGGLCPVMPFARHSAIRFAKLPLS